MTDEQIKVAIAEACGFERWKSTFSASGSVTLVKPTENQRAYWTQCGDKVVEEPVTDFRDVPDYPNDLNAMQAILIEHICGDKEKEGRFIEELDAIIDGYADSEDVPCICEIPMTQICAPCWALAHAFVRTIGKWTE